MHYYFFPYSLTIYLRKAVANHVFLFQTPSMKNVLALLLTFLFTHAQAQRFITKDIKFFGARGDGKTNDHEAFLKAADYFNKRGGHGKLFISKGIYIVGRQTFTAGKNGKSAYEGSD